MHKNLILEFDQFLRTIKIGDNDTYTALLGAGASISSGIQSATDCIWEWKKDIYVTQTGDNRNWVENFKIDFVQKHIQNWLDNEGTFPPLGDTSEYSFYAEYCYPLEKSRKDYFSKICAKKEPSIGYKLLCNLNKKGLLASVWTTNFDNLVSRAAHQTNVTPIEINLDSVSRIFTPQNKAELLLVELHGDFRYAPLKNTEIELQSQDDVFRENLVRYLVDKNLIVSGYSGRDRSLMEALKESYRVKGGGCLFWCGFGRDINSEIEELLNIARQSGRTAFYIPTDGFDKLMMSLSLALFKGDEKVLKEIEDYQKSRREDKITDFTLQIPHYNDVIKSNLYQLNIPQEIYQFQIRYEKDEKAWKIIKELTKNMDVVAVPFKEFVWAFGTIDTIRRCFNGRLKSKIVRNPNVDSNIWRDSALYSLFLSALVKSLGKKLSISDNGKNLIWADDFQQIIYVNNNKYTVFDALELSIRYDGQNYFLALLPEPYLIETVSKEVKQGIGKNFFDKMRNKEFDDYLKKWAQKIFQSSTSNQFLSIDFPVDSGLGFNFEIKKSPNYATIMKSGSSRGETLIDTKFVNYSGIQYDEPKLVFSEKNPAMQSTPTHFHPMKGLVENRPYDFDLQNRTHKNSIDLGVICPNGNATDFLHFLNKQNQPIAANVNKAYLINYPNFINAFGLSLNIPTPKSDNWIDTPNLKQDGSEIEITDDLSRKIIGCINKITTDSTNKVILIFVPKTWNNFLSYSNNNIEFDLHDFIKAYCAERGIATQFIREETIKSSLDCQIHWWLALSYYVKSLRTPWVIQGMDKDTAFAGIGYSIKKNVKSNHIVLGCSHIYNWQGQGLKYKLSKVEDEVYWDNQKNPHLNYNDAFRFGITIRDLFYNAMSELPKRVVIHKQTYFTKDEINGIKDSLQNSGVEKIDLIEINFEADIRFLASKKNKMTGKLEIDGYSVNRGTSILINPKSFLLWTHGIVPSIENPHYKFYLGGRHIPCPLRITKHYGEGTIGQIANEILGLTKMNWNSFDLYTQLPATVYSSGEIARIGKLLLKKEGKSYDYRYFI